MKVTQYNDVVWAKLRYCPYWPSQIVEPTIEMKNIKLKPRQFCVYFFGTHNYGIVKADNVQSYVQNREKFVKRGRGHNFEVAVQECDTLLAEGLVNTGPDNGEVVVKEELDFFVKKEDNPTEDGFICSREVIKKNQQSSCAECDAKMLEITNINQTKKKLINELTSAKESCQEYLSNLRTFERTLTETTKERDALILSNTQLLNEVNIMQKQQQEKNDEIVGLQAELKHLKDLNDNNEYNVHAIVGHKKQNWKQMYLIQWEGYDSSENTWESEKNLKCPQLLKKYKKQHNLF